MTEKDYRGNVTAIIINKHKKVLMCEHIWIDNAWQFPQGGIEPGESAEHALYRELSEEIGTDKLIIIDKMDKPLKYHFPHYLKEKYNMEGNEQNFFLVYFYGDDSEIRFDNQPKPEFKSFKWVDYSMPAQEVIYFKKLSYHRALQYFYDVYEKLDVLSIKT